MTLPQQPTQQQLQQLRAGTTIEGVHVTPKLVKVLQQPAEQSPSPRGRLRGRCVVQVEVSEGKKHEVGEGEDTARMPLQCGVFHVTNDSACHKPLGQRAALHQSDYWRVVIIKAQSAAIVSAALQHLALSDSVAACTTSADLQMSAASNVHYKKASVCQLRSCER